MVTREEIEQGMLMLKGLDLTSMDLSNLDLSSANMSGAILVNVNFSGSILVGTNVTDANLEGADFSNTILHYGNLLRSTGTPLSFAGARVSFAPEPDTFKFVGADYDTPPTSLRNKRDKLKIIEELSSQAGIPENGFTAGDRIVIDNFITTGDKGILTGIYGLMPNGREVYTSIEFDPTNQLDSSIVITAHIEQETSYDEINDKFISNRN